MEHLKYKEPRDVFYKFWATLDGILKQPSCFVYVSGKDNSMDLVAHPGASRGKSSGYVERFLLEPLNSTHVLYRSLVMSRAKACSVQFSISIRRCSICLNQRRDDFSLTWQIYSSTLREDFRARSCGSRKMWVLSLCSTSSCAIVSRFVLNFISFARRRRPT